MSLTDRIDREKATSSATDLRDTLIDIARAGAGVPARDDFDLLLEAAWACINGKYQARHRRELEEIARRISSKRAASPFCRSPRLCAGKGYCPRDPACDD